MHNTLSMFKQLFHMEKKERSVRSPPNHFSVPGTNFTVDWHCHTHEKFVHSFLSHAHEDHLSGIRSFAPPRVVHCTMITCRMLLLKVPRVRPCVKVHEVGERFEIEGVTINIIEAGHTPGSVMFLFTLPSGKKILHTGDFRGEPSVIEGARAFSPIDHLFLDCTFALEKVDIPSRRECVQFIVNVARPLFAKGFLIVIGTYTLGKESLVMDVASALGGTVWAPEDRMRGLRILWGRSDILTDDRDAASIHVVPIGSSSIIGAVGYAVSVGRKAVLAVQATGWAGKGGWRRAKMIQRDGVEVVAYTVPYSDHSSKSELTSFVDATKPVKITPTTQTAPAKIESVRAMFISNIRRSQNRGFIDFYADSTGK